MSSSSSIAIIGAGISGLACANALKENGIPCVIFEKSRGPGGRLTSRRLEEGTIDLGAQYFTAHHESFRRALAAWRNAGVVDVWPTRMGRWQDDTISYPETAPARYCGVPRMSALTRHLAQGVEIKPSCRIQTLDYEEEQWWLIDDNQQRHGPYSAVVISVPTPQAVPLLASHDPALAGASEAIPQHATWTAYALFESPLTDALVGDGDWQGLFIDEGPLGLVARNSTKPGREPNESLSLLATHAWSEAHLEQDPAQVARQLYQAFTATLATRQLPEPIVLSAHRWRFAEPVPSKTRALDENITAENTGDFRLTKNGLGLCGDAWRGSRVEDAWLSGHHLGLALASAASSPLS